MTEKVRLKVASNMVFLIAEARQERSWGHAQNYTAKVPQTVLYGLGSTGLCKKGELFLLFSGLGPKEVTSIQTLEGGLCKTKLM